MTLRKTGGLAFVALALMLAGCRTVLNYETSYKLDPGDERDSKVDAIGKDQKIKVEVSATGGSVDVYVYLEKDKDAVQPAIRFKKASDAILAKAHDTQSATLEATIPAGNAAVVLVRNSSKTAAEVKVKLTN